MLQRKRRAIVNIGYIDQFSRCLHVECKAKGIDVQCQGLYLWWTHTSPFLCLDALPTTALNYKSGGEVGLQRNTMAKKLSSSFIDLGHDRWLSMKALPGLKRKRKNRSLVIVSELAGQYEDSFEDVKMVPLYVAT